MFNCRDSRADCRPDDIMDGWQCWVERTVSETLVEFDSGSPSSKVYLPPAS